MEPGDTRPPAAQQPIDRREATLRHYPYIEQLARRMTRRLPVYLALDDIVSVGVVGLMESIDRFDPKRSRSFNTYAEFRIKGAILDELRAADYLSRDQRTCVKEVRRVQQRLQVRLGRRPDPEEVADELGCDLDRYHEIMARVAESRPLPLRDNLTASDLLEVQGTSALSDGSLAERRTLLVHAIRRLPERLRTVVTLYYYEDLGLREIGELLGVSESRVCQLHGEAMQMLRQRMDEEVP